MGIRLGQNASKHTPVFSLRLSERILMPEVTWLWIDAFPLPTTLDMTHASVHQATQLPLFGNKSLTTCPVATWKQCENTLMHVLTLPAVYRADATDTLQNATEGAVLGTWLNSI